MRSNLAPIGITVEIEEAPRLFSVCRTRTPRSICSAPAGGSTTRTLRPSCYHMLLVLRMPPSWLPEGVAEQVEALFELTGAERRSAAAALADRLATDEVPVAAILFGAIPTLLAPSLGCRVFPAFGYGIDLAALCPSQD